MNSELNKMIARLEKLESQVEDAIEAKRTKFYTDMEHGKAKFDEAVLAEQKELKTSIIRFLASSKILTLLTAPVIYGMIVPFVILDIALWVYQRSCFVAWNVARVERQHYLAMDRHHLAYLNGIEKLNCLFCGYANGLIAFAQEIAARTEEYWCPIKHAARVEHAHRYYREFAEYGDGPGYKEKSKLYREKLTRSNIERPD